MGHWQNGYVHFAFVFTFIVSLVSVTVCDCVVDGPIELTIISK